MLVVVERLGAAANANGAVGLVFADGLPGLLRVLELLIGADPRALGLVGGPEHLAKLAEAPADLRVGLLAGVLRALGHGAGWILARGADDDLAGIALDIEQDAAEVGGGEDAQEERHAGDRKGALIGLVFAGPPGIRMAHANERRVVPIERTPLQHPPMQ